MIDPRRILPLSPALALLLALAAWPIPAGAAPRPSITLELTGEDGISIPPVDLSDLTVGTVRTLPSKQAKPDGTDPDGTDSPVDQLSATLDTSALSNPALLTWIGKGGTNSTIRVTMAGNGRTDTTYVFTGINTWSLNVSQSTSSGGDGQVSLSVGAKHMTINGTTVN